MPDYPTRRPDPGRFPRRALWLLAVGGAALAVACGIGIRRDYAAIPVGQIGFDDLCGLQDYFDTIEARLADPPPMVSAVDIEGGVGKPVRGGKNRFAFESEFQLRHLLRVLRENWSRLPEALNSTSRVDLEVHWSEKAGVRRVVTDSDAELIIKGEVFPLPYHVCLSELLYGEPLYHQRREMTGRPLPYKSLLADAGLPGPPPVPAPARPGTASDAGSAPAAPAGAAGAPVPPPPGPAARADAGAAPAPARPQFKSAPPAQ